MMTSIIVSRICCLERDMGGVEAARAGWLGLYRDALLCVWIAARSSALGWVCSRCCMCCMCAGK